MGGISLSLQRGNPALVAVALLVALLSVWWFYRRTVPPVPSGVRRLLALLRFCSLTLILLLLFDPLLTIESVETIRPNVVLLVDRSASMGIVDGEITEGGGAVTRSDSAESLLHERPADLEEKLKRRYETVRFDFADGLLSETGEGPSGGATDIARAMTEALDAEWERGVDAFLILTDGIVNSGRDPVRAADEFGIPVFAVPIGNPAPARDLSIQRTLTNRLVYVNSRVSVEVTVRGNGVAEETHTVRILKGDRLMAEERVSFEGKRETRTVTLEFPVTGEGVHRYTVEIPILEDERITENNSLLLTVEAVKERLKVLIVAERPGWDFAFLCRTLERDPNVEIECFAEGRDGKPRAINDEGLNPPFPWSSEELQEYDLVFLFGLPSMASRQWCESLDHFVRSRGGGLIFLAVDPFSRRVPEKIAGLLPIVPSDRYPFHWESFSFRLTEEGKNHALMRVERNATGEENAWDELPPLEGANLLGPARPGVSVLAAHPSLDSGGRAVPLFAVGTSGKGRVLLVNGSGYWRWDFQMWGLGKSNRTCERIWSNTVRWMVARGGFRNVTVRPENLTYNRSEKIVFRGLVMDGSLNPVSDARVEVVLTSPEGEPERCFLQPDPSEEGAYRRELGPFPPGDYKYEATALVGNTLLGEESGEFSVSDFSIEFIDTERNDDLLRSLAHASGGRVLPVDELAGWRGDLSLPSRTKRIREEREIWNHPLLFLLILSFLTAEWLIRKRKGLS